MGVAKDAKNESVCGEETSPPSLDRGRGPRSKEWAESFEVRIALSQGTMRKAIENAVASVNREIPVEIYLPTRPLLCDNKPSKRRCPARDNLSIFAISQSWAGPLNISFEGRPFVSVELPRRENDKQDLERDKLAFEIRKFEAEQAKREVEIDKLREDLLELRRPFYRRPALFLTPLSGIFVAMVAGFIAFGTDVLKMNVAALINTRAQLTAENKKLSGEIASKLPLLENQILESKRLLGMIEQMENIGSLTIRGQNGDGRAYDEIFEIEQASADSNIKKLCQAALDNVYDSRLAAPPGTMTWGVDPWVPSLPPGDDTLTALRSPDWKRRIAGIQRLKATKARSSVPRLIELVQKDPIIDVRKAAQLTIEEIASKHFPILDYRRMRLWWENPSDQK